MADDSKTESINESNWPSLLAIVAGNFVIFAVVIDINLDSSDVYQKLSLILPAGLGLVIVRVVNGLLSGQDKSRLVFWRWNHPLPACQAFTVHAVKDERVDEAALKQKLGEWPTDPHAQNALWYKLYLKLGDTVAVQQANRNFLLTRDYAAISFLMIFALGGSALWMAPDLFGFALPYIAGLVIQYLLVRLAARNYGIEVVCNVLAHA